MRKQWIAKVRLPLSASSCILQLASPANRTLPLPQGFQVNSHGIGDRANTVVLDIYERALRNLTRADGRDPDSDDELRKTQKEMRFRVEHAQIMVSRSCSNGAS